MFKNSHIYFIILFLFFASCKKESIHPEWDVNLLSPIAKTKLTLNQIVADSLLQVNSDSSISLVYQTPLADIVLDTIAQLPDTSITYTAKLSTLNIAPINIVDSVSLGDIAEMDKELNGPYGGLYEDLTTASATGEPTTISAIPQMTFDSILVDAGNYFQTISVQQAYVDIKIDNKLPIALTNIIFQLKNQGNGVVLLTDSFDVIAPNTWATKTEFLTNVTLENLMWATVTLSSPGSGSPVTLTLSQSATTAITVRDIVIDSAIARFPSQEIINYSNNAVINTTDNLQIYEAWAKSGQISVDVFNTIEETMHYQFQVPRAKLNNVPLTLSGTIPAATGGNASHTTVSQDLTGYKIDFSGINQDTVNSLYYVLTGSIDSSGNFVHITMNDSIYINCSLSNILPDYARGFFGNRHIEQDSTVIFSVLNDLQIDQLSFNDVRVSLSVENQIGVLAQANVTELTSINTNHNSSVSLTGSALSSPFNILKPNDPHSLNIDVIPTINNFTLNSTNSNINQLISNLPDKFRYKVALDLNQGITPPPPGSGTDFIYYGDKVSSKLNIEVPLSFIAGNLVLRDTVATDFANTDISNVNGGSIILKSENMYPIDASVKIYFLNEQNVIYDSLSIIPIYIDAATINTNTQKVEQPKLSKNIIPVTKVQLNNLFLAKNLIIEARFNTQPANTHVKIYSDYYIYFKIIGDFSYRVKK